MALPVKLRDIVDELDSGNEFATYVNRRTGEIATIADEAFALDETESDKELRSAVESDADFLPLPGEFEINEWSLMKRFADSQENPDVRKDLLDAIHGTGAFRLFKSLIARRGVREKWFEFRREALTEIAVEFLEENQIPCTRD